MQYLWLLLAPLGVFIGISLAVGVLMLFDHKGWVERWFFLPVWVTFVIFVVVPIIIGGFALAVTMVGVLG